MTNKLRVALNMSRLSIMEKAARSLEIFNNINRNRAVFTNPQPMLGNLQSAYVTVVSGYLGTAGRKISAKIMSDRERNLMRALRNIAAYVEKVANGKINVVHLAGLEVRRSASISPPGFSAKPGKSPGSVSLRTKAQPSVFYKWQYSTDPLTAESWITALVTKVSRSIINKLPPGFYWFRAVLVNAQGEHPGPAKGLALN